MAESVFADGQTDNNLHRPVPADKSGCFFGGRRLRHVCFLYA
jgi:hypothetical protein